MKSQKLIDIANDPNHPFTQEAMNTFQTQEGDAVVCKRCGKEYVRGVFNFYDLCDACMVIFNRAKRIALWRWSKSQNNQDGNS